jgi:predicted alpha/beta superfamily hydrolase
MNINPGIKNIFNDSGTEPVNKTQLPVEKIIDTTFVSKFVGDSIKIDVSLPASYNNMPEKFYPIVYMTDGYWRTAEHDSIHQMSDNKEIPEVIVVGIGYPADYNFDSIRVRDLIINSEKFFQCIKQEVMPYVENKYRVDTYNRTLWGASYGGHFLIYAFTEHVKQGKLFKNYICASASLNPPYTHVDLLNNEKLLWESSKELPVNLYETVGGLEVPDFINSYNSIVNAIKAHDYKDFHFEYEVIPNTNHFTVWRPTLLNGLRKFLNK